MRGGINEKAEKYGKYFEHFDAGSACGQYSMCNLVFYYSQ